MSTETINELIAKLRQYDDEYTNEGESSIPDAEYDLLRKKAQSMAPNHPYFATVGSDVRGGKEKLPHIMGSLDQLADDKEIALWVEKYEVEDEQMVITDKLDGISCMSIYRNGRFLKAYSRGNGIEGADISRHVRKVKNFPMTLKTPPELDSVDDVFLIVRGELEMKNSKFKAKYATKFKNPRNMVAGCFNRSTTEDSILADINFIAYTIVEHSGLPTDLIRTKVDELDVLSEFGFEIPFYATCKGKKLSAAFLTEVVKNVKEHSDYELDGIVLTINRYEDMDSQRKSKTTLNPEHSFKFKVSHEGIETTVKNVKWVISKSGFFKPTVEIAPINIGGVTILNATGFNAKFIKDNGIGPGARVRVTRSGDVIPYIIGVTKAVDPQMPSDDYEWSDSGVEALVVDDDNPEVKFKQVLSFVETLQVENLKESTLREVWKRMDLQDLDYSSIIVTLFGLLDGEWKKMVGANGIKIADSLRRRGENMTYELFLGATKFLGHGFGVRKAKALLSQMPYDELLTATEAQIAVLDGFDTKTASKVVAGINDAKELLESLEMDGFVKIIKEIKTSELKGLNVVFTGFRDPDLEKAIEKAGGKVGSSVSSKTTHLLTMDPKSNSGKAKKARDLGVTVMSPDHFKDEYNL
jgi:NAD-dependent DNA ligase